MGAGGGLREGARVCYKSFVVYVIGRIAARRAPDSFWEGRWPEVGLRVMLLGDFCC